VLDIDFFEEELNLLKTTSKWGFFEYRRKSPNFKTCVTNHFKEVVERKRYGIYIVRQLDSKEVLYIGKSGTLDSQGQFKGQDIPKRLKNVKEGNVSANKWFKDLLQEKGSLIIEYVFLSCTFSPAFIEATLLQAFLNEYHRLPYKNKQL